MKTTCVEKKQRVEAITPPELAIDNVRFFNAGTVAFAAFLVPEMLRKGLDVAPLLLFVAVAVLNHLSPYRLARLTHVVKAAWSWVLFSYVGPLVVDAGILDSLLPLSVANAMTALGGGSGWMPSPPSSAQRHPLQALMVANVLGSAVVALFPARLATAAVAVEAANALPRHALSLAAFALAPGFTPLRAACCAVLLLVYREERRQRLAGGMRHAYAYMHSCEHVNIVLLLATVLELRLPIAECLLFAFALNLLGAAVVAAANSWLVHRAQPLPSFVRHELHALYFEKLRANAHSRKWFNYATKPWGPGLTTHFGSWRWIEGAVRRLRPNPLARPRSHASALGPPAEEPPALRDFDLCVGIMTGGAFVACAAAAEFGIEHVAFVRSRLYSGRDTRSTVLLAYSNMSPGLVSVIERLWPTHRAAPSTSSIFTPTLQHTAGVVEAAAQCCERRGKAVSELRVLLIDDTLMSGRTMQHARTKLAALLGVAEEQLWTAALVVHPTKTSVQPDFIAAFGAVPLAWEWGVEID